MTRSWPILATVLATVLAPVLAIGASPEHGQAAAERAMPDSPARSAQGGSAQGGSGQGGSGRAEAGEAATGRDGAAGKDPVPSADMKRRLEAAGFTDLEIFPGSILVRARDKTGKPVAMVLNPRSMTEMVVLDPHVGPAPAGTGAREGGGGAPLTGSTAFATVLPGERLASRLIGLKVVDAAGAPLASVADVVIDGGGVAAYIVGSGGLAGIGTRYVAVTPSALRLGKGADGADLAVSTVSAAELAAAPSFHFDAPAITPAR